MLSTRFGRVFTRFGIACVAAVLALAQPARAEIGAYILIDANSGAVIEESNATRPWYPASLTKMMTAYLTLKAVREGRLSMSSAVVQSANSASEPPSKMGFKVGTKFTVDAALKIILVKSANDVAVALGEAVAGSEPAFISMMNAEARRLGMSSTTFNNPHGLPDNRQVTTARDLAVLAMALRKDFPEARDIYKHPGLKFGKKTLRSANREFLLRVQGANGIKTGYICNSGYNVAASVTRGGRTLIGVVLGASSGLERTAFARELFDNGFRKRGRGNVTALGKASGQPPADGYCRRNKKLQPDEYIARFDMKKAKRGSFLSFVNPNRKENAPLSPEEMKGGAQAGGDDNFVLANGKPNWGKILDRTLGPRRLAYNPIPVSLGNPTDNPVVADTPDPEEGDDDAALANVPVPTPNPVRVAEAAIRLKMAQPAAPAEAVALDSTQSIDAAAAPAAPGSIFRKGLDFSVPVPSPSPRK